MSDFMISLSIDFLEDDKKSFKVSGYTLDEAKENMAKQSLKREKVTLEEVNLLKQFCSYSECNETDAMLTVERFLIPGTNHIRVLRQLPIRFRVTRFGDFYEVWKSFILFTDTKEADEFYYFEKVS